MIYSGIQEDGGDINPVPNDSHSDITTSPQGENKRSVCVMDVGLQKKKKEKKKVDITVSLGISRQSGRLPMTLQSFVLPLWTTPQHHLLLPCHSRRPCSGTPAGEPVPAVLCWLPAGLRWCCSFAAAPPTGSCNVLQYTAECAGSRAGQSD